MCNPGKVKKVEKSEYQKATSRKYNLKLFLFFWDLNLEILHGL